MGEVHRLHEYVLIIAYGNCGIIGSETSPTRRRPKAAQLCSMKHPGGGSCSHPRNGSPPSSPDKAILKLVRLHLPLKRTVVESTACQSIVSSGYLIDSLTGDPLSGYCCPGNYRVIRWASITLLRQNVTRLREDTLALSWTWWQSDRACHSLAFLVQNHLVAH